MIFPTQESNPGLLRCRQILYHLSQQGSPHTHIHTHIYLKYKINLFTSEMGMWCQPEDFTQMIEMWLSDFQVYSDLHYITINRCSGKILFPQSYWLMEIYEEIWALSRVKYAEVLEPLLKSGLFFFFPPLTFIEI